MKYLISKNTNGELIGFVPMNDGAKISESPTSCQVFTADVIPATTLNFDADEVYWLYEVVFSDSESLYVTAFEYSDALVSALLFKETHRIPIAINEYDLYDLKKDGKSGVTTYNFDERIAPVIERLTPENRDLIARLISYADACGEEELRNSEMDYILRVLGVSGKTGLDLSAEEVRKVCSYIWNNYLLFEATGALMNIRRLHGHFAGTSDTRLALLWTYIFEQWAHYDCHLPYTLYRLVLEGGFDDLLADFWTHRAVLE